jgi:iron complex outermembrane recepter protein
VLAEEIRLNSNGNGPWKWSLGGIYREGEDHRIQDDITNIGIPGVIHQVYESKSHAVYGELTRELNELFSLTAGLRYFEDEVTTTELSTSNNIAPFGSESERFDALTPRVTLAFAPSRQTNFYASYSEGFRSGFSQDAIILRTTAATPGAFAPAVEPDKLKNYEVGAKGQTFNDRLAYDLAVYYTSWEDIIQSIPINFGTPTTPLIINGAINAGTARGLGVDLGLTLQATEHFDIGGTLSWNDLQFIDDVGVTTVVFPKDSRPQESPEWTAGAFADYTVPLRSNFNARFGASVNYVSRMSNLALAGPVRSGENLLYSTASVSLEAASGWELTLFGDNLTNEDGRIRPPQPPAPITEADRYRPRTVGLQLSVDF